MIFGRTKLLRIVARKNYEVNRGARNMETLIRSMYTRVNRLVRESIHIIRQNVVLPVGWEEKRRGLRNLLRVPKPRCEIFCIKILNKLVACRR